MKKNKKTILLILGVLLIFCAYRIVSANMNTATAEEKTAVNVKTAKAETMDLSVTTPLTGTIQAENQVSLSAGLQAEVSNIYVKVGDYVSAGTTLFTLNTSSVSGSYGQAQAAYNIAKEGLASAKSNYERTKLLYDEGAVSLQTYEQTKTAYTTAQEQVKQASAALGSASTAVGNGTVTTPISGYVTELNVVEGQFPSAPAATVSDTSNLEVSTNVSEYLISKIHPGDSVTISIKALPEKSFTGKIKTVAPAPGVGSFTYPVIISIDGGQEGIMAGMFAEANIVSDQKKDILAVPSEAVLIKDGETRVAILKDKIPSFVTVKTGLDNGKYVEILSGLSVGDTIVVSGQHYITSGEAINIVE